MNTRDLVAEISMRIERLAQSQDVSPNVSREVIAIGVLVRTLRPGRYSEEDTERRAMILREMQADIRGGTGFLPSVMAPRPK